jgi:sugar lactone lactonase YvrE
VSRFIVEFINVRTGNDNKSSFYLEQVLSTFSFPIDLNTKWKPNGLTVAGGNGKGHGLNQLNCPFGICVDDDNQCIYIADCGNHRIVQWKYDAKSGQIVVDGMASFLQIMNQPTDVIVDKRTGFLIISDWENKNVIPWRCRNGTITPVTISDIDCYGLTIDNNGALYVSDCKNHAVRRWEIGKKEGIIVAGGTGEGNQLNQLNFPTHLFVDDECSLYVSDNYNHRVMKWLKGATEGIVVAGGQGQGDSLTQLSYPQGLIVDHMSNVYVADSGNHRIMRWSKGSTEGQIILGGNGKGHKSNQFSGVDGLSFDRQGNIYVVDWDNHRVQKFEIDSS